ncbi:MAG: mechanosensitive ion channel domain-containing protein [Acidimicrobiia bacterium]
MTETATATASVTIWAVVFIIALPVLIIFAGELQERLRLRGSLLEQPLGTLRNSFLPAATALVIAVGLFNIDRSSILVRLLASAVVVTAAIATLQAIRYAFERAKKRSETPGVRSVPKLLNIVPQMFVIAVAFWILVAGVWDVDLSGIFAALGVTSLIISVALQPTLSGLASGMLLLSDRPFEPGDWISLDGGIEGVVTDIGWRTSRIQDRNGDIFVIPNFKLSDGTITNFSKPAGLHRVVVSLQVAYSNPPTRAKEMLLAAARSVPNVLEDPGPVIRVGPIDDPLMGYDVQMWIDDYKDAPQVKSDFGALVWYQSNRLGVPLPSPAYDLYHHDPIQEAADAEMTNDEIVQRLGLAAEFASLDRETLAEVANSVEPVRFRAGESIVALDASNPGVYLIWQGTARMTNPTHPQSFVDIGEGGIVGDMVASARLRVPHHVVATTDCEVLVIDNTVAGAVAANHPAVVTAWRELVAIRASRLSSPITESSAAWSPDVEPDSVEERKTP